MRAQRLRGIRVRNQRSIRRKLIRSSVSHVTRYDCKFEAWEHVGAHRTATEALNAVFEFILEKRDYDIRAEVGKIVSRQLWCEWDLPEYEATAWAIDDVGADEGGGGGPEVLLLGNGTEEEPDVHAAGYIGAGYCEISLARPVSVYVRRRTH